MLICIIAQSANLSEFRAIDIGNDGVASGLWTTDGVTLKETDMTTAREIATRAMDAALSEAEAANVATDAVARVMLEKVLHIYKQTRSIEDIASELVSTAENLDPDTDYTFMRP